MLFAASAMMSTWTQWRWSYLVAAPSSRRRRSKMTAPNLGRLTTVPPRKVWTHGAQDFTPWLLQNVDVLSDLLGMDLVRRLLRELDAELASSSC